jgi:hypothetical protein
MKTVDSTPSEANSGSNTPPRPQTDGKEKPSSTGTADTKSSNSSCTVSSAASWDEQAKFAHVLEIEYISQKLNVDTRYGAFWTASI